MSGFSVPAGFVRRHRAAIASWTTLVVIAASLVAYAISSDGFRRHKADLNDGGVWVTNAAIGAVGRENVPISQLDAFTYDDKASANVEGLDVLQNQSAVLSYDKFGQTLAAIDVAKGAVDPESRVSIAGPAALGGSVVSVVDEDKGALWATAVEPATGRASLGSISSDSRPLVKSVGPKAAVSVGPDGTVVAASAENGRTTTVPAAPGGVGKPQRGDLDSVPQSGIKQIAAVGDRPAVLDGAGNLITDEASVEVGEAASIQQPGPSSDEVLVATDGELVAISMSGARREVATPTAGGTPGRPVELNGCAWAVWADAGEAHVVSACGNAKPTEAVVDDINAGAELVFRVNRNQILLNDAAHGDVWKIDGTVVEKIDDWDSFTKTKTKDPQDPNPQQNTKDTPPVAKPDDLGVRTGRTTVLHVLDNDQAAKKAILAIVRTNAKTLPDGVSVQVAPDRQSLLAEVAASAPPGSYSFDYTIDDGSRSAKSTDDGKVRLTVRGASDTASSAPKRRENYDPTTYYTIAGGTVEIPVTQDWRDATYGDPIAVSNAKAPVGTVAVTAQGLVKFTAPDTDTQRSVKIGYRASTGGAAAPGDVQVTVIPDGLRSEPAQAQADAAAGQVGGSIVIRPLDNDIPGADPNSPDARLELGGDVAPVQGQPVETDRETGLVTVKPTRPGTFVFNYSAAFGNAKQAKGQIRVEVANATDDSANPVAAPDSATVRGQSPATVDVLANDFDPKGGLLAVTAAEPTAPDSKLEVAIISGRWLRVSATDPEMQPRTQAIRYTVSNGSGRASGSLTVTQEAPLDAKENQPVTEIDKVTVRAGTSVAIPVLDNDSTPSGDPVALVPADKALGTVGTYQVLGLAEEKGTAYLSGRQVRYVAPAKVDGPLDLQIKYLAENTGDPLANRAEGTIKVHITPAVSETNPNKPPTPRSIEARMVQGDLTTLRMAPTGLDPDGDPVSIVAVGDAERGAPRLGRVLSFTGSTIDYQAFPGVKGTDTFSYVVDDGNGGRATGTVRVAVVQPGPPQPPVALDDLVTADSDRRVVMDVLANDLRTPGTELTVEALPDGSPGTVDEKTPALIRATAKDSKNAVVDVPYRATNGIDSSSATFRVRTLEGYNNPPVAEDVIGTPDPGAESVTVDVAKHVYDIDSESGAPEISPIAGAEMLDGGKVRIPVTDLPQTLPYVVTDGDGAVASAVILVPAKPKDYPYLKTLEPIKVDVKKSVTKALDELVGDPEGDPVYFTTLKGGAIYGSPQGALSSVTGKGSDLVITAGDQPGLATVTFTVSDKPNLGVKDAHVSTLTVPVQIGDDKPVITCPDEPLTVSEGGRDLRVDIASVCHVWTSDPAKAASLSFKGSWKKQPAGISLDNQGRRIELRTGSEARRGDRGAIAVAVQGQPASATLNVLVTELPPPTLGTINVDGHAGKAVTVDVAPRLRTQVSPDALDVQVVSVVPQGNSAKVDKSGSKVTVTPKPDTDGLMRFRVEVSDLGSNPGDRPVAVGEIRVAVSARPDAPTNLVAGDDMLSNAVKLTWAAPDENGARITKYEVSYSSSKENGKFPCAGSPCTVSGLPNGVPYTFSVVAINAEGNSDPSNKATGQPDKVSGPVRGLTVVRQDNRKVTLKWDVPDLSCDCSQAKGYRVLWSGGSQEISATTYAATVATNGPDEYTFSVIPVNDKGPGALTTITGMGADKPDAPAQPTFDLADRADGRKAVTVRWGPVAPNGPNPVEYQVTRTGGGQAAKSSQWQTGTSWDDDLGKDGETFSYSVSARNAEETSTRDGAGTGAHVSAPSPAGTVEAASTPDAVQIGSYQSTGVNGQVRVTFTSGASHGKTNRVECRINGAVCAGSPWTYGVGGATDTKVINTSVANGSNAGIEIKACNGSSGSGQTGAECGAADTASTTPYGPIGQPSISVSPSNDYINGSASWNSNGKNVDVVITRNGSTIWSASNIGSGSHSFSDNIGWSQTGTYRVTASEASPLAPGQTAARASQSAQSAATTPPPPKTVTVSKGSSAVGQPNCTDPSCAFIVATTRNFPGNVTCVVTDAYQGTGGFTPFSMGGNTTKQSGSYYGWSGGWVEVTCDGVTSPRFTW